MQTLIYDGYIGKFASPTREGVDEVFDFLNAAGRSPQVYARLYEKVEESVHAGLFWGIWKAIPESGPQLISTSAIFLHGKDQIAITQNGIQNQEYGTYVEHGAALRRKEREGEQRPKGVFMQILMAAPLVQVFCLAGQEMTGRKDRLLADVVVDNVQQGSQSDYVRNFIRNPPYNCEELRNPSRELLARFESSVDDPNVNRAKDFNRFYVTSVPALAEIILNAVNTGFLTSEYKGRLYEARIDLSGLPEPLKFALPVIVRNDEFFRNMDKRTSFREARRLFEEHLAAARLEGLLGSLSGESARPSGTVSVSCRTAKHVVRP
ncbi:MAG: hypothetical protein SFW62_01035 [Alphaproteobacteria bacterium]|nr:hypothetical protein [Alphaproteobacteria bacterium]